jgi:hypothetical protein
MVNNSNNISKTQIIDYKKDHDICQRKSMSLRQAENCLNILLIIAPFDPITETIRARSNLFEKHRQEIP